MTDTRSIRDILAAELEGAPQHPDTAEASAGLEDGRTPPPGLNSPELKQRIIQAIADHSTEQNGL